MRVINDATEQNTDKILLINKMNFLTNTINTTTNAMGYSMLARGCAWCFTMFKQVRISIKHSKRVVT